MTNLSYRDYKLDPIMAVDIETKDPLLREKGNGVYRKDGYVLGVSFSNGEISEYYPLRHPDTTNIEREKNLLYITDQLSSNNRKVFANGMYDLDWLINYEGIQVNGIYEDIQIAEPLIDEYRSSYSLNSLSEKYLGLNKLPDKIREFCDIKGWRYSKKGNGIEHLWKIPSYVGSEYASEDARLTILIFKIQLEILKEQELLQVYRKEMELYPLLLQMRKEGVRIDTDKLFRAGLELSDLSHTLQDELNSLADFEINVNSGRDLEKLFIAQGLDVVYGEPTELMLLKGITRGNPKFDKKTLGKVDNVLAKKILELKHIKTLLNMFIHPYPELIVGDRLHCQFNQLRSDTYGTVSGRFSSSNPNLQQVSGKDENEHLHSNSEILNGQIIRKLFIPNEGCDWLKMDWSQIEYRLIAHYALGDGAEEIRKRYNNDPNTDYHEELGKMTGIEDRKIVKTLNFGAAYSMGISTMAHTYGWDYDQARQVYKMYHSKVPFVKYTSNRVAQKAKSTGFIKTILGRRARIPSSKKAYVMFNRLIQGSAADIMKEAMVQGYKAGVFNVLHPHLTVHDEMDSSMPRTKEGKEAGLELKHIMESCFELKVPIKVDCEIGKSWGDLEKWTV